MDAGDRGPATASQLPSGETTAPPLPSPSLPAHSIPSPLSGYLSLSLSLSPPDVP